MHVFSIRSGAHKGGHIRVTQYDLADSPRYGVKIEIHHNLRHIHGRQLQWIQTFSTNDGTASQCGMETMVDPYGPKPLVPQTPNYYTVLIPGGAGKCYADDTLPWYYTGAEKKKFGLAFSDEPSAPDKAALPLGGNYWTQFVTALAEVHGNAVTHLVGVAWGYDLHSDGSVRMAAIRSPTLMQWAKHLRALKQTYPAYVYSWPSF